VPDVISLIFVLLRDWARKREADELARELAARDAAELARVRPSICAQYTEWAVERGLLPDEAGYVFRGSIAGRPVRFDSGLAGPTERHPRLDVSQPFPVEEPTRVARDQEPATKLERALHALLDEVDLLETLWIAEDGVRLVFETRVHPDLFDAALAALETALRSDPYR